MAIKRFKTDQVVGLKEGYSASPDSTLFGIGQLVFACKCTATCFGECVNGSNLAPAGVNYVTNTTGYPVFCSCPCLVAGGYSIGTGIYVALGATSTCGATLFRRIK